MTKERGRPLNVRNIPNGLLTETLVTAKRDGMTMAERVRQLLEVTQGIPMEEIKKRLGKEFPQSQA